MSNVNKLIQTKYNLVINCLAGLLVKTLFSQEIFVTSVGDLKLNSKLVSPQMPFLEIKLITNDEFGKGALGMVQPRYEP